MNQELNIKAKQLFEQYKNQNVFYCIDNGIFWFEKDRTSAKVYADSVGKELIRFDKETVEEVIVNETIEQPEYFEFVDVIKPVKKSKKK